MNTNVIDIINNRASCRSFLSKQIPDDVLDTLLDLMTKSPTAGGFQNYTVIKIDDAALKEEIAGYCRNQKFIASAPLNLVFCIDYRKIMRINEVEPFAHNALDDFCEFWMSMLNVGIAAHTFTLAAEAFDLKSVYIGNIINHLESVSKLLNLPTGVIPALMLTVGYPKVKPRLQKKYDKSIIVHSNGYNEVPMDDLMNAYREKNDSWNMKAQEKWMDELIKCARLYRDDAYANEIETYFKTHDKISSMQFWHGIYYNDGEGLTYKDAKAFLIKQGFAWLK
ncbi:MAG: nitroreductase family protein [Clostridia bacterium]|nr:nitroreductase family protein [Clostridia bacterium]